MNSIYNEESKQYEILFNSKDVDIIQTDADANVYVFVKLKNQQDWIKIGTISSKKQITAIQITSGLNVKLDSPKPFSYEFKVD